MGLGRQFRPHSRIRAALQDAEGNGCIRCADPELRRLFQRPIGKRDKPTYASVTAGSNGAILLTKHKEMLFFGYLSNPFRTGNLYQKADYAAAANSNVFVISNGQLWAYGTNNDYGQLGNGTRANYDTAQTIRFSK
ncbi:RCC1 domain-containing protein [Paenibacillus thiaminolyticus]|nr:RCC1 domain-containing protein [Paenibacillus thiaminolyticus]